MEEKIRASVVVKTKNSEEKLCETLESIKEFEEIIVLDEHSMDDTIEIANEYKAKIIYADKNDYTIAQNQILQEAKNDWILILEENEILPNILVREIQNYISNPKKNQNSISFFQKSFYLNKEIFSLANKNQLRMFKKDFANFKNNYSLKLALKSGKIYKIKPNKNLKNLCIIKYIEADIIKNVTEIIEKCRNEYKTVEKISPCVIFKPAFKFLYWYFIKGAIFDGKRGFVIAIQKYIETFVLQTMIIEKSMKNDL